MTYVVVHSPVIVTSCWFTKLPDTYARIGISRGTPRGQRGFKMYRKLAPGPWFNTVEPIEYQRRYFAQLDTLDPQTAANELVALAGGKTPALLCFEREPPDEAWCHRGLVSAWLQDTLGRLVPEVGHDASGVGWSHPKLHRACRRA
jgi:hypothetical protein